MTKKIRIRCEMLIDKVIELDDYNMTEQEMKEKFRKEREGFFSSVNIGMANFGMSDSGQDYGYETAAYDITDVWELTD